VSSNWNRLAAAFVPQQQARQRGAPIPWEVALDEVLAVAGRERLFVAVVGSVALAMRGIDIEPGDIDLITDETGAFALQRALLDRVLWPTVDIGWPVAQWFGCAFSHAKVEWAGNLRRLTRTEWQARAEVVEWRGHRVEVPSIRWSLDIERRRRRTEHVAAIERHLRATE
jgi:hypothetical protein